MRFPAAVARACALMLLAGSAVAASWQPVPGAPELEVDLASARHERDLVRVWIRSAGHGLFAPLLLHALAERPRDAHRNALHAEFDCARRTLRVLEAQGHDARGTPVFMASLPAVAQPVPPGELSWAHDAMCEAARSMAQRDRRVGPPAAAPAPTTGAPQRCSGHPRARCLHTDR